MPDLQNTAIACTCWRRPHYLETTLDAWSKVKGLHSVQSFTMAIGRSELRPELIKVVEAAEQKFGKTINILDDSDRATQSPAMHTAIAEAADHAFQNPDTDFFIIAEEDLLVSDDILLYMAWAQQYRDDPRVLYVCSHNPGGQGWDDPAGINDGEADQNAVRLLPYFQAWVCGTWRDRWENVLRPKWDWDSSRSGGWDWNIQSRIIPDGNYVCAVPDASRCQNFGEHGGYYAHAELFPGTQSKSFRASRAPEECAYREEMKNTSRFDTRVFHPAYGP